ncbi:hypothetical protein DNTS_014679 [Danionella cerebrum]|uniref:Microtubule-associated protein 9 n=1 Tax=Danionella cerebrum TaxID=2873325 RepID=A0A553QHY7_9TELE|nr:hypothetical protein DNTS_014679 [Danionella translucida]
MDDESFSTTLAYTKSPKTSRRTTFQDELKRAVSARAPRLSYSDDFEEDEDDDADTLKKLLKTQKEKKEMFKVWRTKGKINDFKLSDDEEENVKPKKVSFMKTKRSGTDLNAEHQNSDGSDGQTSSVHSAQSRNSSKSPSNCNSSEKTSPFSSLSDKCRPESPFLGNDEQTKARKSLSESPLPLYSENSQRHSSIASTPEVSQGESPVLKPSENDVDHQTNEDRVPVPQPRERVVKPKPTGSLLDEMSPRPKPRQKTSNKYEPSQFEEETRSETPLCSHAATSSMSIALSSKSFSEKSQTFSSGSIQGPDESQDITEDSNTVEQVSEVLATAGSYTSEESKDRTYSTSFEETHESIRHDRDQAPSRCLESSMSKKSRPSSSQLCSSRSSRGSLKSESKYLGTLKILDQTTQDLKQAPGAADSIRAAVYQEWLKQKEEKLKMVKKAKKQEEKSKEEKVHEEKLAKTVDAKASYEAWKDKKREDLKKKFKEKQESINQKQLELEQKQERKETAKQVFEKWKEEHEGILKERLRERKKAERRKKQEQILEKEQRKKDCTSAFAEWSNLKQDVIAVKVKAEHRKQKIKEVEEKYEKEEQDKMALEMYDKWLRRKEFQQTKERKEKRIQAILRDDPPPPWSPPNKTIPFRK